MKRSEINRALRDMESDAGEIPLCPAALLPLYSGGLADKGPRPRRDPRQYAGLGHHRLRSWGISIRSDFSLITIRNGNLTMPDKYTKTYAEKLLFLKEGQYSPNHFHWYKMEDIINRGGGNAADPGV